jgi:hypothetical protein
MSDTLRACNFIWIEEMLNVRILLSVMRNVEFDSNSHPKLKGFETVLLMVAWGWSDDGP